MSVTYKLWNENASAVTFATWRSDQSLRFAHSNEVGADNLWFATLPPEFHLFFLCAIPSNCISFKRRDILAMNEADTETLIAMVTSLLTVPHPGQSVVLDTLVQCSGDVQATAASINAKHTKNSSKPASAKRKASSTDLTNWLVSPHPTPSSSKPHSAKKCTTERPNAGFGQLVIKDTTHIAGGSPGKPAVDLKRVLRPPSSSTPSVPRLPPLTLSNPSMVEQHTPCTLHLSVLPPELACELFYTMMDLSRSWKRNRWWLFDRVVESPHRTSFFVRRTNGVDDNESWQEAAQYW